MIVKNSVGLFESTLFWVCDCEQNYIRASQTQRCSRCGMSSSAKPRASLSILINQLKTPSDVLLYFAKELIDSDAADKVCCGVCKKPFTKEQFAYSHYNSGEAVHDACCPCHGDGIRYKHYRIPQTKTIESKGRPALADLEPYSRFSGFGEGRTEKPRTKGGLTIAYKEEDGIMFVGAATCSLSDTFDYKEGRNLAKERLEKARLGLDIYTYKSGDKFVIQAIK